MEVMVEVRTEQLVDFDNTNWISGL